MSNVDLKRRLALALKELDEARNLLNRHPQWGNCKRGCPPAYLLNGFCSPACELGMPRGEFVTPGTSDESYWNKSITPRVFS